MTIISGHGTVTVNVMNIKTRDFTCIQCVFERHDKCLKVFKVKGVEGIKGNDYINICDCCE